MSYVVYLTTAAVLLCIIADLLRIQFPSWIARGLFIGIALTFGMFTTLLIKIPL